MQLHRERSAAAPSPKGVPRVLVFAEALPWPTLKGGDLRTWQNVNALVGVAEVGVFGLCSNDVRRERAPNLDLAFWRASTDPALSSPPPSGRRLPARAWLFDPTGHPSDILHSPLAEAELVEALDEFQPDVVLVEGLWLHGYLAAIRASNRRTILDCQNVEAALFRELAAASAGNDLRSRVIRDVLPARTEAVERAAVAAADQLWVCSDEDAGRLRQAYAPSAPVVVVPNSLCLDEYGGPEMRRDRSRACNEPLILIYPGIFSYPPNAVAASYLVDEITPRLNQAWGADWRLHLVGAMPSAELIAAAESEPRIVVTGAVPDIRPYLAAATAMPVPLFQGGGTRLKVLEAFAAGLPVVSTPKAVEGLGVEHGTHVLLAEDPCEFVDGLVLLRRNPAMVQHLVDSARRLLEQRFSWTVVRRRIQCALGLVHEVKRSEPLA